MRKITMIFFAVMLIALAANSQTIDASYLDPKLGNGTLYRFTRFGNESQYYAGFMWNNTSTAYGNGNDFSIFTYDNRDITVRTGSGNFIVFPTEGGNVGIGTVSPQAKLAVDGNILAKEVKVKTDISVPDYVFEPDYELPSLEDIEAYVKEHKHLPEIPSAADIQRDGLDLAEMNLLLLKKVEEITLLLIEKEKVEKVMKADFERMKVEIEHLKTNK